MHRTRTVVYNRASFAPKAMFATSRRGALNILQCTGQPPTTKSPELGEAPRGRPGGEAEVGTKMGSQREGRGNSGWVAV